MTFEQAIILELVRGAVWFAVGTGVILVGAKSVVRWLLADMTSDKG